MRTDAVPVNAGFEGFYRDARPEVFRALSLILNSRALGGEATDEAFTRAYERWADVSTYDNPAGWVYRVGLNWSRSWLRRKKRETPLPGMPDSPHYDPVPSPELAPALAALPRNQRSVVVLRFYNDWTLEQIATALEIPVGTVKSRLSRALKVLNNALR